MTGEMSLAKHQPGEPTSAPASRLRWLWEMENVLVSLALAVLMLLPLIEIVGRKLFHGGVSGSAAFQQHLVLIIGLLGGMFAARDRRLVALLVAASLVWIGLHPPLAAAKLVVPGLAALFVAVVLGAPIFVMLGGAALILFWGEGSPIASIALTHYSMVTNPTLPTVPLFTLAGYFLAEGGASKRLIRVFQALLGQFRGGP